MFGYLQPYKPYMLVKDFELYKSVYCGLCKQLGKDYGILARLALSYDCTCYAVISMGIKGVCENVSRKHCTFNPFKKCLYCAGGSEQLHLASAITVITVYYKIIDNINDSSFFKSLFMRLLKPFAGIWLKKAKKNYANVEIIVRELNDNQNKVEKTENLSIDECAEPTAIMMKKLMLLQAKSDDEKLIFGEFGYFLGKWVYLMDACDDYEKDIKKNNFNPFAEKLKNSDFTQDEKNLYINSVINCVTGRIYSAYNLMQIKSFKSITDNFINMGLAQMQKKIIFDKHRNNETEKKSV